MSISGKNTLLPVIIVFVISMTGYVLTLCPSVYTGDSGEFITSAFVLGIAHPPGYPLHSLFGKLFTLLPFMSIAYRVNLMSAFFAALTAMLVCLIILKFTKNVIVSATAAIALAFSGTFWSQAVTAEVYTLNAFFMVLTLYILIKWEEDIAVKWLYLLAFIFGLSMTNHYIMSLFLPAYIYFVFAKLKQSGKYRVSEFLKQNTIFLILFAVLGFSFCLFMMVRSFKIPPLNWGDTSSLNNFISQIVRVQYKAMEFGNAEPLSNKLEFTGHLIRETIKQFTIFAVWLGIPGILWLIKKDKKWLFTTVLIFVFNSIGLIFLLNFPYDSQSRFIVEVYYIPAYAVLAIWIGMGMAFVAEKVKKYSAVFLLVPCIAFSANLKNSNMSNYHIGYDYGMNILNTLENDSIYFCSGDDQMFILAYLKMAEKKRPDITVYTDTGFVFKNIYGSGPVYLPGKNVRNAVQLKILSESEAPVYFALGSNVSNLPSVNSMPCGIIYRYMKDKKAINTASVWNNYSLRGIFDNSVYKDYLNRAIVCQYYYFQGEYEFLKENQAAGNEKYFKAVEAGYDIPWVINNITAYYNGKAMYDEILKLCQYDLELDPENSDAFANIGFAFGRKKQYEEAVKAFKKAISLNSENINYLKSLAGVYLDMGKYSDAIEGYQNILNKEPNCIDAYLGIGGIYFSKNQLDEAIGFYEKAVQLDLYNADAHNNLGVVYERKGMFDKAIYEYNMASKLKPAYPEAHYNLGVVYWKQNKWPLVVKEFEEALRINPGYEQARRFLPEARRHAADRGSQAADR